MKKLLLVLTLLLYPVINFGQEQNKHWYFGNHAHLNFTGGTVTQPSGEIMPSGNNYFGGEGCASVSNYNTGSLLFYSDGKTIFGINHQPIINGTNLMGDNSSSQNIVFLPKPGNRNNYFALTANGFTSDSAGLYFSEITIDPCTNVASVLNNASGVNVTPLLDHFGNLTGNEFECITTSRHSNGVDYWIIAQVNDYIYSYLLTSNGIVDGSGVSNKPFSYYLMPTAIHTSGGTIADSGKLKISQTDIPSNTNIARIAKSVTFSGVNSVRTGTFNRSTGAVVFNNNFGTTNSTYGVEFSFNGDILYYTDGNNKIRRRNLVTNTALTDFTVPINTYSSVFELQLATDNNIYVSNRRTNLGKITNANLSTAVYSSNAIVLVTDPTHATATTSEYGLPQLVQQHPQTPLPIVSLVANNDDFFANSCTTTITTSVVQANDTMNNVLIASPLSGLVITQLGLSSPVPTIGGITLNANGTVTVSASTPAGIYKLLYQICTTGSCPSCSNSGVITITVTGGSGTLQPLVINDAFIIVGRGGTSTQSVFNYCTIGGVIPTSSNVVISPSSSTTVPGITVNANGTVSVASSVPNGEYSITYNICQYCFLTNCSASQKIYVTVGLIANTDPIYFNANGIYLSGNMNVFTNDTFVGTTLNPATASLSYVPNPYFSINTTLGSPSYGNITINSGLPSGGFYYSVNYTICELANSSSCHTASVLLQGSAMKSNINVDIKEEVPLNSGFKIYPNPSSGVFNIQINKQSKDDDSFKLEIYNILGQKIIDKSVNTNKFQIDLSNFENSTYFLKFKIGEEVTNKIIIKK
jgi:hypothetical protein